MLVGGLSAVVIQHREQTGGVEGRVHGGQEGGAATWEVLGKVQKLGDIGVQLTVVCDPVLTTEHTALGGRER